MTMKIRASSQIIAGTLFDAQVAANAAIATTKLADGLNFIKKDGSVAFTGNVDMGTKNITNLADPVNAQDAATKFYVDSKAQGLDAKQAVRVATTAAGGNIDLATGGLLTIDGVQTVAGDRVLVMNQTDPSQNGIYTVVDGGAWTRTVDANSDATVTPNLYAFVSEGTVNGDNGFTLATDGPITLGTTALNFTQFNGAGQVIAGAGLTKAGNQIDVVGGFGITANANDVAINLATNSGLAVDANGLAVASSIGGNGLVLTSGVLDIDLSATSGLEFASAQLQIRLASASGLVVDSNGLAVAASFAGNGLTLTSGVLSLAVSAAGDGLSYTNGVLAVVVAASGGLQITSDEVGIKLDTNSALALSANGLKVDASIAGNGITYTSGVLSLATTTAGDGLVYTAGVLSVDLAAAGGLQTSSNKIGIKLDANSALALSAGGLTVNSSIAGYGLTWASGVLNFSTSVAGEALSILNGVIDVNVAAAGGVQIVSDALSLKIASNSALTVDVNGLTVASTIAGDGLSWTNGVLAVVNKMSATLNNGWIYRGNGSNVATPYRDVVRDAPTTSDQIDYTLSYAPLIGTEQVYVNGILQESGSSNDYTVTGSVITFTSANDPSDKVQVTYLATA